MQEESNVSLDFLSEITREKLASASEGERRLAATAVVDAAIWSELARGPVSISDEEREFLIRVITAHPELTNSLFERGIYSLV